MTSSLENRPYGKTGERVTVIGLGGARLNQKSHEDGVATVRRALELGITYFDTSPYYGNGASQAIFGEALDGRSEKYLLATKLGHLANSADFRSTTALYAQLKENLRLLRRHSVDTLQVHEADWHHWWSDGESHQSLSEYDFHNAPVMRVLREAKKQGLCRFIGITGNSAAELTHVLRYVDVDTFLVAFNYDLLRRDACREALPVASEKKVAVVLGGVFQGGSLTKVHPEWLTSPPKWITPEIRAHLERLYALQQECGLSLVVLTIRYLIADPRITTILVGAATPSELEESVAAAKQGPLPSGLHQAIEELGSPQNRSGE